MNPWSIYSLNMGHIFCHASLQAEQNIALRIFYASENLKQGVGESRETRWS